MKEKANEEGIRREGKDQRTSNSLSRTHCVSIRSIVQKCAAQESADFETVLLSKSL